MEKSRLRVIFKELRESFTKDKVEKDSNCIINKIIKDHNFLNSTIVGLYFPIKSEINLLDLLKFENKKFCFPYLLKNGEMLFKEINSLNDFNYSKKIPEPFFGSKTVQKNEIQYLLVPALCYDKTNHRIGYGKGYYDKFLKGYKNIKVGVICKELLCEALIKEEHDISVDYVLVSD